MRRILAPEPDPKKAAALGRYTANLRGLRENGFASQTEFEEFRKRARAAKCEYLSRPAHYLEMLDSAISAQGGTVHFADDAKDARRIVKSIAEKAGAGKIVKGKSMTAEEIGLNHSLEKAGLEVTETDLGEFIIQLLGDRPYHILGPSNHVGAQEVAELFSSRFEPVSDTPEDLTALARKVLRKKFLEADLGITGVNSIACDTGYFALITNEGNGRLCSTLPRTHIAIMGLEKALPTIQDLALFSTLIPRAAMGWPATAYLSWTKAASGRMNAGGPGDFHLVIVDNGRGKVLESKYWEILLCVRCSSCLNYCPVYEVAGGHNYPWVYSGPMGSVLSPLLHGQPEDFDLAHSSTLCGRCKEMCPMHIDLPAMLQMLRKEPHPPKDGLLPRLGAAMLSERGLFEAACKAGWLGSRALDKLPEKAMPPGSLKGWAKHRAIPKVQGRTVVSQLGKGSKKRG